MKILKWIWNFLTNLFQHLKNILLFYVEWWACVTNNYEVTNSIPEHLYYFISELGLERVPLSLMRTIG